MSFSIDLSWRRAVGGRILLLLAISCLTACSAKEQAARTNLPRDVWAEFQEPGDRLVALLPEGKYPVEVLQLVAPKKFSELGEKLAKGMGESPLRLAKALANATPGEPLAYDPAFGLTEDELQEFLRLKDEMRLQKVGSSSLGIVRGSSGAITINLRDSKGNEESLTIHPDRMALEISHGTFSEPTEALASAGQRVTGPWNSYEWRSGGGAFLTGKNVSLCLGQIEESKDVLLIYRVKNVYTGEVVVDLAMRCNTGGQQEILRAQ